MKKWLLVSHAKLSDCYSPIFIPLSKELYARFRDYILTVDAATRSPFDILLDMKPDYVIVPYVLYDRLKSDIPNETQAILLSDTEIESEFPYINLDRYPNLVDNTVYYNKLYKLRDIPVAYISDYNKETSYTDLHELLQTQDLRIFSNKSWPFKQYCGSPSDYADLYNRITTLLIDENTPTNITYEAYNCGCKVYNLHDFTHKSYTETIPVYSTYSDIVDNIKKVIG